jgi:hypothetical protein
MLLYCILKVVCLEGEAKYVQKKKKGSKPSSFQHVNDEDVLAFATMAINELKRACPRALIDGLTRVDIFQLPDGKLVVNEFESLEADFQNGRSESMATVVFLEEYWLNTVNACIAEVVVKAKERRRTRSTIRGRRTSKSC